MSNMKCRFAVGSEVKERVDVADVHSCMVDRVLTITYANGTTEFIEGFNWYDIVEDNAVSEDSGENERAKR